MQPPDGATNLPLNTKVSVTASGGQLTSVVVTSADGTALAGTLDPGGQSWQSTRSLGAPRPLHRDGRRQPDRRGRRCSKSSSFTTLTPDRGPAAPIFPNDGLTVGVGMPIELRFNHSVPTRRRSWPPCT